MPGLAQCKSSRRCRFQKCQSVAVTNHEVEKKKGRGQEWSREDAYQGTAMGMGPNATARHLGHGGVGHLVQARSG